MRWVTKLCQYKCSCILFQFMQHSPPKSVEDYSRSTKLPNTGPVDAIGVIGKTTYSLEEK